MRISMRHKVTSALLCALLLSFVLLSACLAGIHDVHFCKVERCPACFAILTASMLQKLLFLIAMQAMLAAFALMCAYRAGICPVRRHKPITLITLKARLNP